MEAILSLAELNNINFSPKNEVEEILQNVGCILSTIKGTVPLDRDFGVSPDFLDAPMNVARVKLIQEVVEKVPEQEPRATVKEVLFDGDGITGKMQIKVILELTLSGKLGGD